MATHPWSLHVIGQFLVCLLGAALIAFVGWATLKFSRWRERRLAARGGSRK
jgi:hypothetical protein